MISPSRSEDAAGPVGDATPRLVETCREIQELYSSHDADSVCTQWNIGQRVLAVMNGPEGEYGCRGVQQMVRFLGRKKTALYQQAAIADEWSGAEINSLADWTANADGPGIDGRHLVVLHRKRLGAPQRRQWIQRALDHTLTPRELSRAIEHAKEASQSVLKTMLERLKKLSALNRGFHGKFLFALDCAPSLDAASREIVVSALLHAERNLALWTDVVGKLREVLASNEAAAPDTPPQSKTFSADAENLPPTED